MNVYPDSTTKPPRFLTSRPDWSKPVVILSKHLTTVGESDNGGEQRGGQRRRPRYTISFMVSALTVSEFAQRRVSLLKELRSTVVIPIWTDPHVLLNVDIVATCSFGFSVANRKFKVGSYAYFEQAGHAPAFRKILTIESTGLSFVPDGLDDWGDSQCLVYPCIVGTRPTTQPFFTANRLDDSEEAVIVEEL